MRTILIAAAAGLALAAGMAAAQAPASSVNAGVYSDAQAARGETIFGEKCGICHELTRFTGDEFTGAWAGQPLQALYSVMKTSMPEDNPDSLPAQEYADVLAFFLKANQYPAGAGELKGTDEAMAAVLMESPRPR